MEIRGITPVYLLYFTYKLKVTKVSLAMMYNVILSDTIPPLLSTLIYILLTSYTLKS